MPLHKSKKRGSSSGQRSGNGVTRGNTGRFSGGYATIPTTQRPTTSGDHSRNGVVSNDQLPMNSTYNQMLTLNSNDEFSQLLASLGITQQDGLTGDQRDDWNKALLDMQLKHYADVEQRGYNEQVLAEQRRYDSPLNQLARLMGAGISRDAAIQMLSGSGGSGAGAGSALIGGAATDVPTGPAASESKLNGIQAGTAIAGAVFNSISCLSGLVNLGFSIPQAIQQTQFLKNQNFLTSQQIAAYKSAGSAYSILKTAGAAADAFGSVSSAVDAISQLAKEGNTDAATFIAQGGIDAMKQNAPFASKTLGEMYRAERSSADYARDYEMQYRKNRADTELTELQYDALTQEIENSKATYANIVASTEYQEQMTITCRALGLKYDAETNLIQSQEDLVKAQFTAQTFENQQTAAIYGSSRDGKPYLEWLSNEVIDDLVMRAQLAAESNSPDFIQATFEKMFNEVNSVAAVLALQGLSAEAGLNFATKYPKQFSLWEGLRQCGAYDYLHAMVEEATAGKRSLPFGISSSVPAFEDGPDFIPTSVDPVDIDVNAGGVDAVTGSVHIKPKKKSRKYY